MANFNRAYALILTAEGGYVNDPDDPGGETYRGVSRRSHPKWPGWNRIDGLKGPDGMLSNPQVLDRDKLLQDDVKRLYNVNYWLKIKGDKIKDQDAANVIFDFAVNAGCRASIKIAQTVTGVTVDGVMGNRTLLAINSETKRTFLAMFSLGRIARYTNICEKRPASRKYFFGWVKRSLKHI